MQGKDFKERKKKEMKFFLKIREEGPSTDMLYLIDYEWFASWVEFIRHKETFPPKPINNEKL